MKTVYKYPISYDDVFKLELPVNAKVIHIAMQHGSPCMWVQLDLEMTRALRSFVVVGTGQRVPANSEYVGSVMDGIFVWHIYELKGKSNG